MRQPVLLLLAACHAAPGPGGPEAAPDANDELDRLAAEVWEATMRRYPTWATYLGDRRFDAALPDLSEPAADAWRAELGGFVGAIDALDRAALTEQRRVTADVIRASAERQLDALICQRQTWDVDQLDGWQVALAELAVHQPLDTAEAIADYVTRLAGIGALFEQHLDNLRRGLAAGRIAPRVVVDRVLKQLETALAQPDTASPFVQAAKRASLPEADVRRLQQELLALYRSGLRPALQRYRDFLAREYVSRARPEVGVSSNPGGRECYSALIRYHTALDLTPERIHATGIEELERLHTRMDDLAKGAGYPGRREYFQALTQDPSQYLATREALLTHNEKLVARATAALPRAFGVLPAWGIEVIAIEGFREADAPAGYYYQAAPDGSRPAYYYVNTYQPQTRPLFNMEALAFHEAVPGHHLQIAIGQRLELPEMRRNSSFTAFVEGWALYSELVADELGLYSSPATRLGMLNYQAWRASRLVVDTGMHALGWDRNRAVSFMKDNVELPAAEIENEIDRYVIWPGQALAYMLGRLEIQALRREAETELGARFSLARFHDALLGNGAVPLSVLRRVMQRWVEAESGAPLADSRRIH